MDRDIRPELRARFEDLAMQLTDEKNRYEAERAALEARYRNKVAELDRNLSALQMVLELENKRVDDGAPELTARPAPSLPFAQFVLTHLFSGGPASKEDLRTEGERYGYFEDAAAGRTLHTTLMNLVSGGKIIRLSDGRFAYPEKPLLEHGGAQMEAMN